MVIRIIKKGNKFEQKEITPTFVRDGGRHIKVVRKAPLTMKQEKVVALVANGSTSKAEILREAGYSEAIARQPHKVFDSPVVQEAISPVLRELIAHRDEILVRMREIFPKAGYTPLSITLTNLNKDIELLSGKPTSREEYVVSEEEQKKLDDILKMNS